MITQIDYYGDPIKGMRW